MTLSRRFAGGFFVGALSEARSLRGLRLLDEDARSSAGRTKIRSASVTLARKYHNSYIQVMEISFDPRKREATLRQRGLDFEDAVEVFDGDILFETEDDRRDYAEARIVTVGFLRGRMVVVVWTPRGSGRRIVSMRKANDREQARFRK